MREQWYKVIHSDLNGWLEVKSTVLAEVLKNLHKQGLVANVFNTEGGLNDEKF